MFFHFSFLQQSGNKIAALTCDSWHSYDVCEAGSNPHHVRSQVVADQVEISHRARVPLHEIQHPRGLISHGGHIFHR